jgi:lipid A 3-O-deacylase
VRTFPARSATSFLLLLAPLSWSPARADGPPVLFPAPPTLSPVPTAPTEAPVSFPQTGLPIGAPAQRPDAPPEDSPFVKGRLTFEALSGSFFAPVGLGPRTPTFDYAPVNFRLGCVLNTAEDDSGLSVAWEILLDGNAAWIYHGFGDVLGGPGLLLRWNAVLEGCPLVPYLQIGGCLAFNDAHDDHTQRAIGSSFEFLLEAGVGCRYFVNENWALNAEFDYHHISNANTNRRNAGINALGGLVGVSYFFPRGQ